MKKKDINQAKEVLDRIDSDKEFAGSIAKSEELTIKWLQQFYQEINEIDEFYWSKFISIVEKFVEMQAKYLMKAQRDGILRMDLKAASKAGWRSASQGGFQQEIDNNEETDSEAIYEFISPISGKPIILDRKTLIVNSDGSKGAIDPLMHKEMNKMRQRYLVQMVKISNETNAM